MFLGHCQLYLKSFILIVFFYIVILQIQSFFFFLGFNGIPYFLLCSIPFLAKAFASSFVIFTLFSPLSYSYQKYGHVGNILNITLPHVPYA